MFNPRTRVLRFVGLALALVIHIPALAQNNWTGNISGDWFDAGNWTGDVPVPGENVQINTSSPNAALIDALAGDSGHLVAGFNTSGSLTISNAGSLVSSSSTIGHSGTADGIVRVTGAGSSWTVGGSYFEIGNFGTGELVIENGGQVFSSGLGAFGRSHVDSSGSVTVTGAGSVWHGGSMYVGWTGSGELTISDGGQVYCNSGGGSSNCAIGFGTSGQGQVVLSGQGSLLQTDKGFVQIGGNAGSGSLLLSDRATLAALGTGSPDRIIHVARLSSATGTLIVGAPESEPPDTHGQIDALALRFGEGDGHAVFNHSGTLTLPINVIGPFGSGTAQLSFLAGTTLFAGDPDPFNGEDFNYSGTTTIAAGASFGATGILGDTFNHGTLMPAGEAIGILAINGNYVHGADARVVITIGADGNADFIAVTGNADLQGGTVGVTLTPRQYGDPLVNGLYPILTADGGITGQFDGLAPGTNTNGFALIHSGNTVYLEVSDGLFSDRFAE